MAENDDDRLARLRGSLAKARGARRAESPSSTDAPPAPKGDSGMSLAMRAGSEFISAIIVGAGLGWALDRLLGTNPFLLILFFFLGVAAGVWNVIRQTSPKGGGSAQDSPLSRTGAADKGGRRSGLQAGLDRSRERGPSGGAPGGPDDDED